MSQYMADVDFKESLYSTYPSVSEFSDSDFDFENNDSSFRWSDYLRKSIEPGPWYCLRYYCCWWKNDY